MRIVHHDPTCRVCQATQPGLVATAGPQPPAYPNPLSGEGHGGPEGTHWYHGTKSNPAKSRLSDRADDGTERYRMHSSGGEYGARSDQHWNTDLGVHFSALHSVAHDDFAANRSDGGVEPDSRIAHATLHMRNPAIYKSEHHLTRDAINWAHEAGHRYLPENKQAHKAFVHRNWEQVEDHDEAEGKGRSYDYHQKNPGTEDDRRIISDIDTFGPKAYTHDEREKWLGRHPDRERINSEFRTHLQLKGHDGIIYGNEYEGPVGHPSSIAFPSTPVHIAKMEQLHPQHPDFKTGTRMASADWNFSHINMEGPHWRTFGGPAHDPRRIFVEYKKHPDGQVQFQRGSMHDFALRKHGPEAVGRVEQAALQHHEAGEFDPASAPQEKPKQQKKIYYHGTTVADVTHVLPAARHNQGVMFPHDTSAQHAYASLDKSAAWNYAEKAHHITGGKPRVYQVRPIGGHQHVEEDPQWDDNTGRSRGNFEGDRRSKHGFEVVRELKTPQHIHDSFDWPGKEQGE